MRERPAREFGRVSAPSRQVRSRSQSTVPFRSSAIWHNVFGDSCFDPRRFDPQKGKRSARRTRHTVYTVAACSPSRKRTIGQLPLTTCFYFYRNHLAVTDRTI